MSGTSTQHDASELSLRKGFLGHPVGLGYLSLAYSFERFAFYGMQALLALYMTRWLLLPGNIEHVWGLDTLAHWLGASSTPVLASSIYGLYLAACYATPLVGGYIGDRILGRTPTIILGAIFLIAGHFLMAFEPSFLLALLCLLTGVGLMKGNVATQIGDLYAVDDLRRSDAFQIFVASFQLAGILAPLICGTLGETVGWHYGFAAAGISMVISLAIYLAARRHYPPDPPITRRSVATPRVRLGKAELRTMFVLVALVPVLGLVSVVNDQIYNAYILWGADNFERTFFGHEMPASWLGSIDTTMAIIGSIAVLAFWRRYARGRPDADEITKVAIGGLFAVAAALTLALGALVVELTGQRISLWWAIAFEAFDAIGFAMIYAIGMALFIRAAPRSISGLIIGIFYLHLVISNLLVGWLGGLLEQMPATHFWLLHAAFAAGATALLFIFRALFHRQLAPMDAATEPSDSYAPAKAGA